MSKAGSGYFTRFITFEVVEVLVAVVVVSDVVVGPFVVVRTLKTNVNKQLMTKCKQIMKYWQLKKL